jgi:hypothetical protein
VARGEMQSAHKIVHKIRLESQREDLEGLQRQTYVPPIGNRSPGYFVTYTLYAPVWLIIQLAPFSDRHGCVFVRLEPHREDLEGLQRQTAMVLWSISACPEPVLVHDRPHLIKSHLGREGELLSHLRRQQPRRFTARIEAHLRSSSVTF